MNTDLAQLLPQIPIANDYISFLLRLPHVSWMGLLTLFILGLMRLAPIVSFAPFLGGKLPGSVKMGLAISLSLVLLPQIAQHSTHALTFNLDFIGYSLKELLMGLVLAIMAGIPFYIAESSGILIDFLRGSSSLQVTDPVMQSQTSSIGVLFNYVLIVLFFEINGPFIFLNAVSHSFQILPVDVYIPETFFNLNTPFWKAVFGMLTRVTAISVQLAAPSIVAILMAEMFLGIANRLAPQVQIVFLGMSLKSLLGLGLLWAAWFFILKQMGNQSLLWLKELDKVLQSMSM